MFHRDCVSVNDENRESQPSFAITEENVITIRQLIKENRLITYEEMLGHLGIGMS